ncbi:hypothetical protein bsdtw1_03606 [Clostridium fungisolvens]|uniref:Uncharacterized protein n=1 Tax=Clostridium fungisolvens TaxID=1604897 RepID=A0A6V8SQJ6_9CLOT|nr:hypothetical protein bsdtw1_03606 [Clostridium fungisolvens]
MTKRNRKKKFKLPIMVAYFCFSYNCVEIKEALHPILDELRKELI